MGQINMVEKTIFGVQRHTEPNVVCWASPFSCKLNWVFFVCYFKHCNVHCCKISILCQFIVPFSAPLHVGIAGIYMQQKLTRVIGYTTVFCLMLMWSLSDIM